MRYWRPLAAPASGFKIRKREKSLAHFQNRSRASRKLLARDLRCDIQSGCLLLQKVVKMKFEKEIRHKSCLNPATPPPRRPKPGQTQARGPDTL